MTWSVNWDAAASCNGAYSYADAYERIFISIATNMTEVDRPTSLSIRPNPASEQITLALPADQRNVHAIITDISGRVVFDERVHGTLNIVAMLPGLYVLNLPELGLHGSFVKE